MLRRFRGNFWGNDVELIVKASYSLTKAEGNVQSWKEVYYQIGLIDIQSAFSFTKLMDHVQAISSQLMKKG